MLEQFKFLEPLWFLALLPLLAVFWLAFQKSTDSRSWEKIIDPLLLPLLLQGEDKNTYKFPKFLLALVWIIAVIALADPVWEKIPRPILQTNAARVLVLDLSNSMLIDDMKPNRLARARFKIEDILSREEEGQTGLVLFAGEAFTAAPLTRDTETIRSMLKVLTPQIMPAQGSRADLGLVKAHELLKQSGIAKGQVLLIADGVSKQSLAMKAATDLRNEGHSVSVMAVGTEAGGVLNFRDSTSVSVKLDAKSLSQIAKIGGGKYHLMTTNNTDIKRLLTPISDAASLGNKQSGKSNEQDLQNSDWLSTGPWLVLVLLPFAALAFRRGWLLNVMLVFLVAGFFTPTQEVFAADEDLKKTSQSQWQDNLEKLTKNKAQRANSALIKEQYEKARELAEDPMRRGSAEYKLEDFEAALSSFKNAQGADARYNEGNALAKLEKYKEAIAAYDESLKLNSSNQDALDNKKAIEDLLKQQQESGKNSKSSSENQQGNSDSQNDKQDQQSSNSEQNKEQNNDQQSGSHSEGKKGEDEQKNSQNQEEGKEQKNQFSDANKDIDKNKQDAEGEAVEAEKNQTAQKDKKEGEKSKDDKSKASAGDGKDAGDLTESLDKEGEESEKSSEVSKAKVKELAEDLSKEEKMAAEQWLRRIPDDPGGLLRRKFRHQYNQTRRNSNSTEQPW